VIKVKFREVKEVPRSKHFALLGLLIE